MSETRLSSIEDLKAFAAVFLGGFPNGAVVALSGDLGAGKTTFVRAVIECLALKAGARPVRVTSPSFVIHQSYPELRPPVEHFDLYRLENVGAEALLEIGYFEALERNREARGFLFVEWPEKVSDPGLLQTGAHLRFEPLPDLSRILRSL